MVRRNATQKASLHQAGDTANNSNAGASAAPDPGLALRLYSTLTRAAAPLAPILIKWRRRHGKEDPTRAAERLGKASLARPSGPLVWLHAASVGETNAILPLIGALQDRAPKLNILLTTGTVTSAELARTRLGKNAIHQFAPLDMPQFIDAFLDHWAPDTAIFAESEIWPNLVLGLSERGVPLALVNGRLSERSFGRWLARPSISGPLFGRLDLVLAHNEETASRFAVLGAHAAQAVGNLKIDGPPPPADKRILAHLRTLTKGRPILLAASTHPGEDQAVLSAHTALARRHAGLLTLIAPRHPERGPAIAALADAQGLQARLRSADDEPDKTCEVYVTDTIGELGLFYRLAPIAFIGGSLVPHGGQNPIEAAKCGCAVITGAYTENFSDAYEALMTKNACLSITDADELETAFAALLENKTQRTQIAGNATRCVASMGGALGRTLAALEPLMPWAGSGKSVKCISKGQGVERDRGTARAF